MAKAKSQSRLNIGIGAVYPRKFNCGIRWFLDYRDKNDKRIHRVIKHVQNQQDAIKALREEVRRVFDDEYLELHAKVNKKGCGGSPHLK